MPLGMAVGLGPGHIVLDEDPALPQKGAQQPHPHFVLALSPISTTAELFCRTRLSTIGDGAFPVAAAHVWNGLPQHVTSTSSLSTFHRRLKTRLFQRCFF